MYISRKRKFKILAYCATAIIVGGFTNIASAEIDIDEDSASNNEVTVINRTTNESIFAEYATEGEGDASRNTLNVRNVNVEVNGESQIDAAWSVSGNTDNNTLNIWNVNAPDSYFHGGYARGYGNATNNVINFYSGKAFEIHGGHAIHGDALNNTVNFYGGTLIGEMGGGYSNYGNVNYNTMNVYGGEIDGKIYGGRASYGGSGSSGDAIGDTINISGGTIDGDIYGGWAPNGYARNNNLNIYGNPDLGNASLYAGRGKDDDAVSGNNLSIYTQGITARNIYSFENLNFILPENIGTNPILTLTDGATDLTQTRVNVNADGSTNIGSGDVITLLANSNGINTSDVTNDGTIAQGISLDYGMTLGLNDDGTAYLATIGEAGNLKEQTNILGSGIIDSASLLDSGTDRLAEWLPPEGLGESIPTTQFNPFAGIGGSVFKIKTGDGQKLKSKNAGLDVGMARFVRIGSDVLAFGPITDYGRDSYESRLTHTRYEGSTEMYTTDGSGTSQYFAAGIIARQMNTNSQGKPDGMYYEGSVRGGRVHTNFSSDNFLVHNEPTHASYSASTPCFAGHVRIGWAGDIGGTSRLDAYSIYSLNRVNGFTTKLSTGEEYRFSAVNSGRMRVGARLTRDVSKKQTFYSGLACVHEFTGETHGEYLGRTTDKTGLSGTSGIIELGWRVKQADESTTMFDASMVGWVGHQKGVTFSAKFKREF